MWHSGAIGQAAPPDWTKANRRRGMTRRSLGDGGLFEDGVELDLGAEPRPSARECASMVWGPDADYRTVVEPPDAAAVWRMISIPWNGPV